MKKCSKTYAEDCSWTASCCFSVRQASELIENKLGETGARNEPRGNRSPLGSYYGSPIARMLLARLAVIRETASSLDCRIIKYHKDEMQCYAFGRTAWEG